MHKMRIILCGLALALVELSSTVAMAQNAVIPNITVAGQLRRWTGSATGSLFPAHVAVVDAAGNHIGTSANPFRTDPTGTTAQPVTQSTNWPVRLQDGAGNAITSNVRGAERPLSVAIVDAIGTQITDFGGGGSGFANSADNVAVSITNGKTAAWLYVWDGSAWDRLYGDSTNGAFVNVKTSVLPTLASTSTKQSDGSQKSQIVDGSGNVIASTSNNLNVQCANCSGSGVSTADEASFTAGTSLFAGTGGFFQTTATNNALTNGQQGMFQVTANRALFTNLRNAAGTEVGTSGAPIRTDPVGTTTQPVSAASLPLPTGAGTEATLASILSAVQGPIPTQAGTVIIGGVNVAQINGVTPLMGQGATGTGSPRVTIANDNTIPTGWPTAALQTTANSSLTTIIGHVDGIETAIADTNTKLDTLNGNVTADVPNVTGPLNPATAVATKSLVVGGQYTSTQPTLTTTQQAALAFTARNAAIVAPGVDGFAVTCSNCSGSGVSAVDASTFTPATTSFALGGGFFQTTATANSLTTGQQGGFQVTANRALFTNLRNAAGTEVGTSGDPIRTDPVGTTTQPVSLASVPSHAVTNDGTFATQSTLAAETTKVIGTVNTLQSSPYPAGANPYTASTTGTTAATTATLAGVESVTTYICGFSIRANATAAVTGNATVTGTITGTLNFTQWTAPAASGLGITEMIFAPCVPASAANTSIAVVSAAPGTGGVVSVTSWGYKL